MAEQQPDRAVALLDDYRGDIDGFDAQRRAKLNLLRADAQALNGELMKSLRQLWRWTRCSMTTTRNTTAS